MNPYEDLIHALGSLMGTTLNADQHQSCLIHYPDGQVSVQIDLDTNADQILIGSQLGEISVGAYREKVLLQAMRVNGCSLNPRGFLAYSEKNNTLVLYQFFPLAYLTATDLNHFLLLFTEHARIWKGSIEVGEIPRIEEDEHPSAGDKMFGLG